MLGRLFRTQNRTTLYNRAHRIAASILIGISCASLIGLFHQLYKAKTEYLPEIRRRGKERLEAALAIRQTEAELAEQQRLADKTFETSTNLQQH